MTNTLSRHVGPVSLSASALIFLTLFMLLLTISARSQEVDSKEMIIEKPSIEDYPERKQRVGILPEHSKSLSLQESILLALSKNTDIEIQKITTQQTRYDLAGIRGAYDLNINTQFFFETKVTPTASLIGGASASGGVKNDTINSTFTLSQLLKSGGKLSIDFNNLRTTTNNTFAGINPSYNSLLSLTFNQPLLRNFKIDTPRFQILLNKKKIDISYSQFKQQVTNTITKVQQAYWNLVFAKRDVGIKEEAVQLAKVQLNQNKRFVEAGTLAPVEIVSVEAQLEQRQEDVFISLEQLTRAENELKKLLSDSRANSLWNEELLPTELINIEPITLSSESAVEIALKNRPEMEQYNLQKDINKLEEKYLRNQLLPQFDFFTSYSLAGLSGTPLPPNNPLSSGFNSAILERINTLSGLQNLGTVVIPPSNGIPRFFSGGFGQDLGNLFTRNFRDIRIGFSFNFPIQNRTAKANLGKNLAQSRILSTQQNKQEQNIESEVRNALQTVKTTQKRIQASQASRIASEAQLASETRKYEAGESTNFLVLDRQNSLSAARGRELKAIIDYKKAVAELELAISTTLSVHHIQIQNEVNGQPEIHLE